MCFISLWAKAHFAGSFFCSMDYFVASESTPPPHALHRPQHRAVHCGQRGQRAAHARVPALALTLVFLGNWLQAISLVMIDTLMPFPVETDLTSPPETGPAAERLHELNPASLGFAKRP